MCVRVCAHGVQVLVVTKSVKWIARLIRCRGKAQLRSECWQRPEVRTQVRSCAQGKCDFLVGFAAVSVRD